MNHKSRKNKWILYFIAFLLLIYFWMPFSNDKTVNNQAVLFESTDRIHSFKACMREAAEKYYNISEIFFIELKVCIRKHISIDKSKFDNFPNYVNEENKIFLPLKNQNEKCRWLTVGIGGVENSEKLFKLKYPYCSVYGVEPGFAGNFSDVGKLIPFGVGLDDNETKIVVNIDKHYMERPFKVLSLATIMDNYIGSRFIHYLTIDIEGYEYKILEQLVGDGKFTEEKSGIVFCQIDAEFHNPKMDTAHSAIKDINQVEFMLNFLQNLSPFIPIFNAPYTHHPHQKVTFINIKNPDCETAFGFTSYF